MNAILTLQHKMSWWARCYVAYCIDQGEDFLDTYGVWELLTDWTVIREELSTGEEEEEPWYRIVLPVYGPHYKMGKGIYWLALRTGLEIVQLYMALALYYFPHRAPFKDCWLWAREDAELVPVRLGKSPNPSGRIFNMVFTPITFPLSLLVVLILTSQLHTC